MKWVEVTTKIPGNILKVLTGDLSDERVSRIIVLCLFLQILDMVKEEPDKFTLALQEAGVLLEEIDAEMRELRVEYDGLSSFYAQMEKGMIN